MSALPPKADIGRAQLGQRQSITSSPIAIACHNRYWDISRESTPDRSPHAKLEFDAGQTPQSDTMLC
jgi:hypothetical protein